MFMGMLDGLKEESVGLLFNAQVQAAPRPAGRPDRCAAEPRPVRRRCCSEGAGGQRARPPRAPSPPRSVRRKRRRHCASRESSTTHAPPLTYTGPSEDGSAEVQRQRRTAWRRHAAPTGGHAAGATRGRAQAGPWRRSRRRSARAGLTSARTGRWRSADLQRRDQPAAPDDLDAAGDGPDPAAPRVGARTPRPPSPRRRRTSTVRSRTRRSTAAPPVGVVRVMATTASISVGANSVRSCATGLRRSTTSRTRRSAVSANTAAARGGAESRAVRTGPAAAGAGCAGAARRATAVDRPRACRRAVVRSR